MCTSTPGAKIRSVNPSHLFLHIYSWLVAISVGRSCQKEFVTVFRSPPCGLQLTSRKANRARKNVQNEVLLDKMRSPDGQGCQKHLRRKRIALVSRAPGMHSGCRGEVAAAASCAEPKRLGVAINGKKYPVVEQVKNVKSLHGLVAEQSRTFVVDHLAASSHIYATPRVETRQ